MITGVLSHPHTTAKPRAKRGVRALPATLKIPPLVNGDKLDADEFLRRYEAMPEIKKAELIDGVVYIMASPVSAIKHGVPDSLLQTWAGTFSIFTPGVQSATNSTTKLGIRSVPQPDGSLRYSDERRGMSHIGDKGYIVGPPELVFEISASSALIDIHQKKQDYLKSGVQEYVSWLTDVPDVKWWYLKDGQYHPLPVDDDGILRSRVFPGLWLDPKALIQGDGKRVMAVLQRGMKSKEYKAFAKIVSKKPNSSDTSS